MIESTLFMKAGRSLPQLIRYGMVGGVLNLALYLSYLLINALGTEPKRSMTVVYLVGLAISFASHRRITFAHAGNARVAIIRYLVAHCLGYLINLLLLHIFVDRLQLPHQAVQGIAIFVVALYLFLIFKYWVFFGSDNHG